MNNFKAVFLVVLFIACASVAYRRNYWKDKYRTEMIENIKLNHENGRLLDSISALNFQIDTLRSPN